MLLICPEHGPTAGIELSPDLAAAIDRKGRMIAWEVRYHYLDDVCLTVWVSEPFGQVHGISRALAPLPHVYSDWFEHLKIRCLACASRALTVLPISAEE
ncbi:MAG: hypothetical protein SF066_05430 [Thermoanaerobaculia bacterium]|nr:hypothetical protein [Thermoanaerobaculia bacterium]